MQVKICCLLLPVTAVVTCLGQTDNAPVPLRVLEETPVKTLALNVNGYRAIPGTKAFYLKTAPGTYVAIDLEGFSHTALDLAKVPATDSVRPNDLFIVDLTEDAHGGVVAPVVWTEAPKESAKEPAGKDKPPDPAKQHSGILRFDANGDFDQLVQLDVDSDVTPTHVAEFSSAGSYVVSGYDHQGHVHLSLNDFRGKVIVPQLGPRVEASASGTLQQSDDAKQKSRAIQAAMHEAFVIQLVSSDDDGVYVFNPSWGRKVLRVGPSGEFKEIDLARPALLGEAATLPMELFISHANLFLMEAILSKDQKPGDAGELKTGVLSVYDRFNGTLTASYEMEGRKFGMTPVALSSKEFDFLTPKFAPGQGLSFVITRAGP